MDVTAIASHFRALGDFEADVTSGSMANYVFIEPNYGEDILHNTFRCGNSQHPLDDITHGERLIKRVYEALRASPLWQESVLVVAYDEGGGFYDHVAPGATTPPGDSITEAANNHHNFDFAQLGVRVPAVVCSPWIARNVIDHSVYEHASVPRTLERLWGLPGTGSGSAPPPAARPPRATLLDASTLARAAQESPGAIASTAAGFLGVALRRDLLLAPAGERRAIFAQVRRFTTVGEAAAYTQLVRVEVERERRRRAQGR
jgi:phospholipase C